MLRFCRLASHKTNLIIYDFSVSRVLISSFCTSASDGYIEALGALGVLAALETLEALENMRVESIVLLRFCRHYQNIKSSRYDCSFLIGVQRAAIRRAPYL